MDAGLHPPDSCDIRRGLDMLRSGLWDFEGTKADVRTQLNDDVVSIASSSSKISDFVVGQPDFVFIVAFRTVPIFGSNWE